MYADDDMFETFMLALENVRRCPHCPSCAKMADALMETMVAIKAENAAKERERREPPAHDTTH